MGLIANFKRDIARHRGRSAVLGVLFVMMVVFSIRAFVQLRPTVAAAAPSVLVQTQPENIASSTETQARIEESQELWSKLREKKAGAASASVAFTFDPTLYPAPIADFHKPTPDAEPVKPAAPAPQPQVLIDPEAIHRARILEEARKLQLKSTAVGDGIAQPVAIINQKLVTAGQIINGFTLNAIRSREVELTKEGVTAVITMSDGQ